MCKKSDAFQPPRLLAASILSSLNYKKNKIMLSKNYILSLSVFVTSIIMLTASCKKSDDISNLSPSATGDTQSSATVTESYQIVAQDGHTIGINGKRTETNVKQPVYTVNSCGTASLLTVNAVSGVVMSDGSRGCALYDSWTPAGGACMALIINGQLYKDAYSGYGLWSVSTNAILAEYSQIAGGINSGSKFNTFIRTYCNADTTGSSYNDSPITAYTVPDGFSCGVIVTKHHKK